VPPTTRRLAAGPCTGAIRVLVTGSAGHLGEALVRTLRNSGHDAVGLDRLESVHTDVVASVTDRAAVRAAVAGADAVVHSATLHKPHVVSHSRQDFVDTNVTGTLTLLEEAVTAGVGAFVYTSTTSAFGRSLTPGEGAPAAWITEDVVPRPRNIYGSTKVAAEDLCELVARDHGLSCVVLRTSRFFPEQDDSEQVRTGYTDANAKVNELLYRRIDLSDVVGAHLAAVAKAPQIGFGRYIVSATTPFGPGDLAELRQDAPAMVERLFPEYLDVYERLGWRMFPGIDRVYVNARARAELGWAPRYDFRHALDLLRGGEVPRSALATSVGAKGYHPVPTGPYTTR
jgi:nucleoside-diphosphate-sugar epimerase